MRFNPASIIKIKIVLVFLFISFNLKDNLELAFYDNQLITFMPIDTAQQALHIRRKKNTTGYSQNEGYDLHPMDVTRLRVLDLFATFVQHPKVGQYYDAIIWIFFSSSYSI